MRKTFLLLLLLLVSSISYAKDRPKIGVALSGGGARGFAHIGVLRALEEKNIPIDYIAGTSMGSIVGGLYATGMTTDDLEWVIESIDWEDVMRPSPNRLLKDYRQRQEEKIYISDLELGIDEKGVTSGTGIASDHKVMLELQRIVGSFNTQSFDDYPIPFRAVTTDLNSGEPYVIDHGELAMAMRASMAVPLVFGPVKYQDRMLADGGLLNNLPVDVVKEMGADIVIAVDISSPLTEIDEKSSLITVTYQSIDVSLVQNTKRSLKKADVVVQPELGKLTSSDFSKADQFVNLGYLSVYQNSEFLENLRIGAEDFKKHLEVRNFLPREIPKNIDFVDFEGNERTAKARLYNKSKHLIGKDFDTNLLQKQADLMVAEEEDIQLITYHIVEDKRGKGVVFKVKEKRWGPDYLKFGLQVSDEFDSNNRISLLIQHKRQNINKKGAHWTNDLSLGSLLYWRSKLYQPLDFDNRFFATANLNAFKDSRRLYDYFSDGIGEYDYKKFGFGIGFGFNPSEKAEWQAGIWYLDQSIVPTINQTDFEPAINRTIGLKLNYGYDTLEKPIAARFGSDISTEIGVFDRLQWFSFKGVKRLPMLKRSALHLALKGDFSYRTENDEYFVAYGGIDDFAGYPTHSLLGINAFIAELGWFTKIPSLELPLIGSPDLRIKAHVGNVWQKNISLEHLKYGFSSGISFDVLDTVLFFGTGYTRDGDLRFYLRIGTGF